MCAFNNVGISGGMDNPFPPKVVELWWEERGACKPTERSTSDACPRPATKVAQGNCKLGLYLHSCKYNLWCHVFHISLGYRREGCLVYCGGSHVPVGILLLYLFFAVPSFTFNHLKNKFIKIVFQPCQNVLATSNFAAYSQLFAHLHHTRVHFFCYPAYHYKMFWQGWMIPRRGGGGSWKIVGGHVTLGLWNPYPIPDHFQLHLAILF